VYASIAAAGGPVRGSGSWLRGSPWWGPGARQPAAQLPVPVRGPGSTTPWGRRGPRWGCGLYPLRVAGGRFAAEAATAVARGCDDGGVRGIILCLAKLKVDMSSSLRWSPPWELASICRPPSGPAGSGHAGCPTGFLVGLQGQQTPCFACWCVGSLTKV